MPTEVEFRETWWLGLAGREEQRCEEICQGQEKMSDDVQRSD